MNHINPTDLIEHLQWRYATKKFDATKTIPPAIWTALADTLVLTPSSYGLQPWKFLVITNKQLREQLQSFSWNQAQVTDCSHFVVFTIKKNLTADHIDRFIARTAKVRGITEESIAGFRKILVDNVVYGSLSLTVNEWSARQVYISLGNFMTSAAMLGVDTCPMEGLEPANYDKLLGLSEKGFATVVACAAGYRSEEDKYETLAKVRFPKAEVLENL